jgi:hypothetical protein
VRILYPVVEPSARFLPVLSADLLQGCTIGTKFVGHDHLWLSMLAHCFSQEFQRSLFVSRLRDKTFQRFPFVIHLPPEIVYLPVDLHEDFVEMPLAIGEGAHPAGPSPADPGCEYRAKSVPPKPDRFMRNFDPALV